jgi:hypothetical protein
VAIPFDVSGYNKRERGRDLVAGSPAPFMFGFAKKISKTVFVLGGNCRYFANNLNQNPNFYEKFQHFTENRHRKRNGGNANVVRKSGPKSYTNPNPGGL